MQKKSFDSIPVEDVISWNSIVGYLHMESSLPHLLMSIQQLSSLSSMVTQRRKIALTFDNPN